MASPTDILETSRLPISTPGPWLAARLRAKWSKNSQLPYRLFRLLVCSRES